MADKPDQRIRVLLIEDNRADARLIEEALVGVQGSPFALEWVDRLCVGLERLERGGVDVVLLDLSLPDSRGLDSFLRTQAKAPGIPILVLTGMADEGLAFEAVQKGAQDYIGKAFVQVDNTMLIRAIRYAIERKSTEQELMRLASFPEQDPNAIIEADLDGRVTYLNPAARTLFPELAAVSTSHPLLERLKGLAETLSQEGKQSAVREITLGNKVYEQQITYIPNSRLARSYVVDITERKQIERLKDEFLSTVSHELRTPLATIKEFTAILSDGIAGPTTPDQRQYLSIMQGNIERLARMINELLDMAKIESGGVLLRKGFLDTGALLDHIVRSMEPLAEQKSIRLSVELAPELPAVFADRDKVTQILINLVGNAIKYTDGPGKVTISVKELENEVAFCVADTGIGIGEDDLPQLFQKFRQFQQLPEASGSKGTGLGLAICKRLVELHGGRIWAESRRGVGSLFFFALPKYHLDEVFREYLKASITEAQESHTPLSILAVALERFEQLQARHKPEELREVFQALQRLVEEITRHSGDDLIIRWQRGELVVLLPGADRAGSAAIAQRISRAMDSHAYRIGDDLIGVATGTATYPDDASTAEELIQAVEGQVQRMGRSKCRILTVDDEPKVRRYLKELLELQGFEVLSAASGADALALLGAQSVDLILLDVMMPVMDGFELYHLLKENPKTRGIPVLIVTGRGERGDRLLGMQSSTYHYLTKPVQPDELLAKIQELLQHSCRQSQDEPVA